MDRYKTCRCCLLQGENEGDLYKLSFFTEITIDEEANSDAKLIKLSDCFTDVTGLQIEEDTENICVNCSEDLKFCYIFKQKCINNAGVLDQESKSFSMPKEFSTKFSSSSLSRSRLSDRGEQHEN